MQKALRIKDGNDVLVISYEDILKYHGRQFIGGVGTITEGEQLRLQDLKEEIAQFLLMQKPEDLFEYCRTKLSDS